MTDHKELIERLRKHALAWEVTSETPDGEVFNETAMARDCAIAAAALEQSAKREAELVADRERLREALNRIASWPEGETVSGSFDEPGSAQIARDALAATPAQSLAAIEARVLEEAAQACDSLYDGTESSDYGHVLRIKDITDECSTELRRLAAERK